MEFQEFPKMARWSRDVVVTEKIDGTNAAVVVAELDGHADSNALWQADGVAIYAQSRTRFITPTDDNFGFARWIQQNAAELAGLGPGRHFGEWWGAGIQRRYGLAEKRFSLFNVGRWFNPNDCDGEDVAGRVAAPACCHVVPILAKGPNEPGLIQTCIDLLRERGSYAAPGFMKPEGVVLFHLAAGIGFKKTLEKDEVPKTLAQA
jgi:hypothetical protein